MVGFGDQAAGGEGALVFEAVGRPSALFDCEEGRGVREVVEEEVGDKGDEDSYDAFEDEAGRVSFGLVFGD